MKSDTSMKTVIRRHNKRVEELRVLYIQHLKININYSEKPSLI